LSAGQVQHRLVGHRHENIARYHLGGQRVEHVVLGEQDRGKDTVITTACFVITATEIVSFFSLSKIIPLRSRHEYGGDDIAAQM